MKKQPNKDKPLAIQVLAQGSEGKQGASLHYAWEKVRDQDAFILFDLGSTHNFVLHDMVAKLGIHFLEMGPKEEAEGAFEGQQVLVTPLFGKLQVQV